MYVIKLGEDTEQAKTRFNILVTAAFQGKAPGDIESTRNLGKLQTALEDMSVEEVTEVDDGMGGRQKMRSRVPKDDKLELILTHGPYHVLKDRIFGAGIEWLTGAARRVEAAYDAVADAREVKPDEVTSSPKLVKKK